MIHTRSSFTLILVDAFDSLSDVRRFIRFSPKEVPARLLYMRGCHEHRGVLLRIQILIEMHCIIRSSKYQFAIASTEYTIVFIASILTI